MSDKNLNRGHLEINGDYASITFVRQIAHPPQAVWSAITDPAEIAKWFMASFDIDPRAGGRAEFVAGPSKFHSIGKVLTWQPIHIFEYEYKVKPRAELPDGEDAVVRWELTSIKEGTLLKVTYSHLTKKTSLGFLPGLHVFLDRLQAQLDHTALPTWAELFPKIQHLYPEWKPVGQFK